MIVDKELIASILALIMCVVVMAVSIWQINFIISNGQWHCLLSNDPMFCTKVMLKGE
jgi:hypothetical protein